MTNTLYKLFNYENELDFESDDLTDIVKYIVNQYEDDNIEDILEALYPDSYNIWHSYCPLCNDVYDTNVSIIADSLEDLHEQYYQHSMDI